MGRRRIVVAGGTGFLGRALGAALADRGDEVVVLTRNASNPRMQNPGITRVPRISTSAEYAKPEGGPPAGLQNKGAIRMAQWSPGESGGTLATEMEGAAAVVNLAGESIGGGRWTENRKRRLRDSRLVATRSLVAGMRACDTPPRVFVSASAVGYYGTHGDERLAEESRPGSDFLARLCVEWENAAMQASGLVPRIVIVRSGMVLDRDEGALPRMLTPFKFFVGGAIGSGQQYISWIHLHDWVRIVMWAIDDESVQGPVNATAPQPVTNMRFTRAIAAALHRPAFMPVPAVALRVMLGEMADSLVIRGQRVLPERALAGGFRFQFSDVTSAMSDIVGRG